MTESEDHMPPFPRVSTIMPTPFDADGALDLDSLAQLTRFLVGTGVDAVTVLGVMGEAPKLDDAEQEAVLRTTVEAAGGRIPVYAGSSAAGTELMVRRSLRWLELGAAGLLVAPPPVQSDRVIAAHYARLDAALQRAGSGAPIILHDYPATTGIRMSPELVARLAAELPSVRVIKLEDPPTAPKISAIRALDSDIVIVGGLGGTYLYEELERGADGIMTGLSYPEVLVRVCSLHAAGDRDAAREAFYRACPLLRFEFQPGVGLALRKEVYRRRGAIAHATVRSPGAQIDAALGSELSAVLAFVGAEGALA